VPASRKLNWNPSLLRPTLDVAITVIFSKLLSKVPMPVLPFDGEKLIGTSRALSDGVYHAFIYDVAVLPVYQGQGIGSKMAEQPIERNPFWRAMLRADVEPFYRHLGFDTYSDVMAPIDVTRLRP